MKWLKDQLPQYAIGIGTYADAGFRVQTFKDGGNAELSIGKFCAIAANVTIFLGGEHRHDWITTYPFPVLSQLLQPPSVQIPTEPISGHPKSKGPVRIGNDVWIGQGATILSGVTIGDGAVIGAGSLVCSSVPPYTKVAGNPARVIGERFARYQVDALLKIQWWDWPLEKILSHIHQICHTDVAAFVRQHDVTTQETCPCAICQSLSLSS